MQLVLQLVGVIDLGGGNAGGYVATESLSTVQSVAEVRDGGSGDMIERDEGSLLSSGVKAEALSAEDAVADAVQDLSIEKSPARPTGPVRRRALGMKTMSRPPVGWATGKVVDTPAAPFSVRGFTYGCAMGGTAAAVALLIGQLLFG
mgnify:FL=1